MELLSTKMYAAQSEGGFLQMAENLLSGRLVAIGLCDDLFDLLRDQSADGDAVFRSDDLCAANRLLVELDREISSAHARILRAERLEKRGGRWRGIVDDFRTALRSEERRVGKECRAGGGRYDGRE